MNHPANVAPTFTTPPTTRRHVITFKEKIDSLINDATEARLELQGPSAREFSLAITALEDAGMRYTRGRAIQAGWLNPADLDAGT